MKLLLVLCCINQYHCAIKQKEMKKTVKVKKAFVLRLPEDLKKSLELIAKEKDFSLNTLITYEMKKVVAKSKAS